MMRNEVARANTRKSSIWFQSVFYRMLLRLIGSTWNQSVPPRGSGWVRSPFLSMDQDCVPTRYREVVLTAAKFFL
jgi:hypothetical protein